MLYKLKIKNLDCANCAQKIEDQLNKRTDVDSCSVNFITQTLTIELVGSTQISDIQKVITQIEPGVLIERPKLSRQSLQTPNQHHHHEGCDCGHSHESHDEHHHENGCNCDHNHERVDHDLDQVDGVLLRLNGLDCPNCAQKIEDAFNKFDWVNEAVVSFSTLSMKLSLKHEEEDLINLVQKEVDKIEDGIRVEDGQTKQVIEQPKLFSFKKDKLLVIGVVLYIIALIIPNETISIIGYLSAYLVMGYPVLKKAFFNLFKGHLFDENFLMAIATLGAIAIGEYPEAIAVMLFFSIGEIFQSYAVNKSRHSITDLMDLKSEYALVKIGDTQKQVDPTDVQINDIIIVKVGEKVPLDGIVISGESTLDTSSLTGESLPRTIKEGEDVLAGVINLSGLLEIQVTKEYKDSTVSKIIDLIENASSKKAPIEQFITRFAKVYTPIVVFCALALAIIPQFIFNDVESSVWVYRALTFLVVSCPCALVVSVPLGLYAGVGKASRLGVLVKGGNYLEQLQKLDTIVFDKTGTLTYGRFSVVDVVGHPDTLMYGAYGEALSNHPIAKSITKSYTGEIDYTRLTDFKEIAGKGIEVTFDGIKMLLGNYHYLSENNIVVQENNAVGTVVYIALGNEFIGSIVVADTIKETSQVGLKTLKESGIKETVMLTGDRKIVAQDIAAQLGIDTVYSDLLPQDKVTQLETILSEDHECVGFVGDGINDAPVLARSDIGFAMGGIGSDAAIEAADVVLMNDDIGAIGEAIQVSKKTHKILIQNITFTLVIKIGVLILTMFGFADMWMGVFADVGVTLIAIANSMRIMK